VRAEPQSRKAAVPAMTPVAGGLLQRKCACGGSPGADGECAECKKKQIGLQRKSEGSGGVSAVPPIVHEVLGSPGQPLDDKSRSFMEPRLGHDFSRVRVHTDRRSSESARAVNALAYTVGRDLVFDSGQYAPHTPAGRRLLAHELTHVVQQRGSSAQGELSLDTASDNIFEREAERAERAIDLPSAQTGTGKLSAVSPRSIRRAVRPGNVSCHRNGLRNPNLTGDQAVAAIEAADADAITLASQAELQLDNNLTSTRAGDPVDASFDTILQEELGLTLTNPAHFRLIEQQRDRFARVRGILESGYLRYMCRGGTGVSLVGCLATNCEADDFAFTCPGNRLIVLCQSFWDEPAERPGTVLHETFHIPFSMVHTNTLRRANAFCFEGFARRVAGEVVPDVSCQGGAH
jgi:hypothetical protein